MPSVIDPTSVVKLKNRKVVDERGRWVETIYTAITGDGQAHPIDHATMRWLFDSILDLGRNLVPVDPLAGSMTWEVRGG